jgi:hypothetical protein
MEKPYEAPKLLVAEGEIYESIAAGIASAVTSSATSSMTSCSAHQLDSEFTADRTTLNVRPVSLQAVVQAPIAAAPVAVQKVQQP